MAEIALHTVLTRPACATDWPVPTRDIVRPRRSSTHRGKLARNASEITSLLPAHAHHLCGQVAVDHDPRAAHPGVPSPTSDT